MAQELKVNPGTRIDEVGHTISGQRPETEMPVRGHGELAHPDERLRHERARSTKGSAAALAAGRVLFGGYFLYNGINHFRNRSAMAQYARTRQVPAADAAVIGSGALIAAGGLSLLTGTRPRVGASLITAFLLGVTPRMHAFWDVQDEGQRMGEFTNFAKNVALVGGAALVSAIPGPWPFSVDALTARRAYM